MAKHISELTINQDVVSIIASGNSVDELLISGQINYIKERSFTITINYAPLTIRGHMNVHCDKKVSEFLYNNIFSKEEKNGLILLSRERAFDSRLSEHNKFLREIDFMFSESKDALRGNYTIVWMMQLLEKYFNNKKVLVFGLDMYPSTDNNISKWYDKYTSFDREQRGPKYPVQQKLNNCAKQIDDFVKNKKMFINCNPNSGYNGFVKTTDWKKELDRLII